MYKCICRNNTVYDVKTYCILKKQNLHPKPIFCAICGKQLIIKAENSIKKTHFSHKSGESCNENSYIFSSSNSSKSTSEILSLKFSIFINLYNMYIYITRTLSINLTIEQFIKTLKNVSQLKILKLVNIDINLIPFIFLNILGETDNKLFLYTNSKNFKDSQLWNFSDEKDVLLIVETLPSNNVTRSYISTENFNISNIKLSEQHSYIYKIKFFNDLLKFDIFTVLRIPNEHNEIFLHALVCEI